MKFSRILITLAVICGCIAWFATHVGRVPQDKGALVSEDAISANSRPGMEQAESGVDIKGKADIIAAAIALLNMDAAKVEQARDKAILEAGRDFFAKANDMAVALQQDDSDTAKSSGDFLCTDTVFQGKVGKGETLSKILEEGSEGGVAHYLKAASKVFSFRAFREGQTYVITRDAETGKMKRFEYEINDSRRLVVEGMEKPRARLERIEYTVRLEKADGIIEDNLFQAVADCGENPQMAFKLVNLFGSEINFIKDIQPGDSFSALVEKRYRDGEYKGYGRIVAASFTNRGKKYEAFLFRDSLGKAAYYNRKGENLHKTLLQAPLSVTRLTSRFTHSRKHPILGFSRPHLGVDYGAPTGTPVKAVGEGVVTQRGWNGGYGNQIIVKHGGGLESLYAHLSGFARGLKPGQKVTQGQVIGFVGSTGLSTGPHLDFRLRQNGRFVDPTKAINPRSLPVSKKLENEFKRTRDLELACLEGDKKIDNYTVDSIVPLPVLLIPDKEKVKKDSRPSRQAGARSAKHAVKRQRGQRKRR